MADWFKTTKGSVINLDRAVYFGKADDGDQSAIWFSGAPPVMISPEDAERLQRQADEQINALRDVFRNFSSYCTESKSDEKHRS